MDLRNYVLVDTETGTILSDPRKVMLVHDENIPVDDASDSEIIEIAEQYGIPLDPDSFV